MEIKGYCFDIREFAGALGDLGTFLPLAIALIPLNGVNASSVFLAAGLLYLCAGLYYRIPMPVQPLKATAIIAISMAATPQMISATAISMGIFLLIIRRFDLNEILKCLFPRPVVRGIQLSLGLVLVKKGLKFFLDRRFLGNGQEITVTIAGIVVPLGILIGLIAVGFLIVLRNNSPFPAGLAVICLGIVGAILTVSPVKFEDLAFGWEVPGLNLPSWRDYYIALPVLLLPQLPLTFANSIVATTDTANQYFGLKARKVRARTLFTSLGLANLLVGFIGGIPVCHGSGGLTAHYRFGGRTGGSSIIIGGIFIFTALVLGRSAPFIFNMIPLAVLGVMLIYIGVFHCFLIKDILDSTWELSLVLAMAVITLTYGNLVLAFAFGISICLMTRWLKISIPKRYQNRILTNFTLISKQEESSLKGSTGYEF
jgi:SulP family sulfate permease